LIRRFFDICLFRAAPQDLPGSTFLMSIMIVAYIFSGLLVISGVQPWPTAIKLVTIDTLLLAGLLYLLLWGMGLGNRFCQTYTAILGAGVILQLASWPILAWQGHNITQPEISNSLLISSLLLWTWLLWNVLVIGHILKHALSSKLPYGIFLAMFYLFLSFNISRILVPGSGS